MKTGNGTAAVRRAGVATLLATGVALTGCEDGSNAETSTDEAAGVLEVSDLAGDGWETTDEGGDTLCGRLSSQVESMSGVSDASEVAFQRDDVLVVSEAWIENSGSGTRRADFDRIRSHADACGAVDDPGDFEIAEFEIVEDEADRFVVHERRMISGVEGGADQLYFREGTVVGRVVVVYEGDAPQLAVTDLEEAARTRAAELAEIGA